MTKLSCMNKHFQVDIEKRFVKFHSRTIRMSKAFTVFMRHKRVQQRNKYAIFCAISVAVERFGNRIFYSKEFSRREEYSSLVLVSCSGRVFMKTKVSNNF